MKILYRESESHGITKKLFMVLVKYHHVSFVWNKHLLTKNIWYYKIIFSSTTTMFSLKLSFMSAEYRVNLNNFPAALFIVWQMIQCILLTVQCFYLRRNKGPLFLLSTRNKEVVMIFHENQILSLRNQYRKNAT